MTDKRSKTGQFLDDCLNLEWSTDCPKKLDVDVKWITEHTLYSDDYLHQMFLNENLTYSQELGVASWEYYLHNAKSSDNKHVVEIFAGTAPMLNGILDKFGGTDKCPASLTAVDQIDYTELKYQNLYPKIRWVTGDLRQGDWKLRFGSGRLSNLFMASPDSIAYLNPSQFISNLHQVSSKLCSNGLYILSFGTFSQVDDNVYGPDPVWEQRSWKGHNYWSAIYVESMNRHNGKRQICSLLADPQFNSVYGCRHNIYVQIPSIYHAWNARRATGFRWCRSAVLDFNGKIVERDRDESVANLLIFTK